MTPFSPFQPGAELICRGCEFSYGSDLDPDCLIAIELRDEGEHMGPACCPRLAREQAA